jgi:hypothetical protein
MKNSPVKLSALALILGLGAAFASAAPHRFATKTWGLQSNGTYVDVTGQSDPADYHCTSSSNTCTAVYPAAQDPNVNPANPSAIIRGDFSN